MIAERADFDERYFPLSKRPTVASFPPPSVEVESTPSTTPPPVPRPSAPAPTPASTPYYIPPDSDDSESIQITLGDDSQCTVIIVYLSNY